MEPGRGAFPGTRTRMSLEAAGVRYWEETILLSYE